MGKCIAIGLGIVVLVLLGTGGGYLYGVSVGEGRASQARQQFAQGRFAAQGGQFPTRDGTPQPAQPGGPRAGGGIMGTIEAIEGDTLVVRTQSGNVRVKTTDTTLIEKLSSVAVSELKAGEQVMVSGSRNDDDSISARSVQSVRGPQALPTNQP